MMMGRREKELGTLVPVLWVRECMELVYQVTKCSDPEVWVSCVGDETSGFALFT